MKKIILGLILIFSVVFMQGSVFAAENLGKKLFGRILLQVEGHGEAWYVNPQDKRKYFLNRPLDAFNLMKALGIGISDENLNKVPVGFLEGKDSDGDGLNDNLEKTLGTDYLKLDTDGDGYNDQDEILNNYNPLGSGKINIDKNFVGQNLGKIFLQTEKNGEAWYIDPIDQKRYFLGRPSDAFALMRQKALGISNLNLNKIPNSILNLSPDNPDTPEKENIVEPTTHQTNNASATIQGAASAIRSGNRSTIKKYFISDFHPAIDLIMNYYGNEGRLSLGNLLSSAKFLKEEENYIIYSTEVYFSLLGEKAIIKFYVEKQENGEWLLINL